MKCFILLVLGFTFFSLEGLAQISDPTYNTLDQGFGFGDGFKGQVKQVLRQPDGKILACGDFESYNGIPRSRIARLKNVGGLDAEFVVGTGFNGNVNKMVLQPDGKILIGGDFSSYNQQPVPRLVRLNADGTLDNTYNLAGTGPEKEVNDLLRLPDGKVLVAGNFENYNAVSRKYIVRLNPNGSLDPSFFSLDLALINPTIQSLAVQSTGQILLAGIFGSDPEALLRLDADGNIDDDFNEPETGGKLIRKVWVDPSDRIYILGNFETVNGENKKGIARLFPDGGDDDGFVSPFPPEHIAVPYDIGIFAGKLMVAGQFENVSSGRKSGSVLLDSVGAPDPTFNQDSGANRRFFLFRLNPTKA